MRLYEVKTISFCASRYRVRCPEGGLTWADKRAPTHDTQRQHAHHAEVAAAKQELQAQRHINQAHMHRVGGPTVWGV